MRFASIITIAAAGTTLEQAQAWLRVDGTDEDDTLTDLISEVYSTAERRTGRLLREATAELTLPAFPTRRRQELALPFTPVRSVVSCNYTDTNGDVQSLTPHLCVGHQPGLLLPPIGEAWPATQADNPAAVVIRYECGAAPTASQQELLGCIKLLLDLAWHEHTPQEQKRLESRTDRILQRWSIRDSRLDGITYG